MMENLLKRSCKCYKLGLAVAILQLPYNKSNLLGLNYNMDCDD